VTHVGRGAFVVVAVVPAAACPPGAPLDVVGYLVVGIARFVTGASTGLGVGIGGMHTMLGRGGHCESGAGGDGGDAEKREFGHGCSPCGSRSVVFNPNAGA